ncbi:MAG: 4Fe-4S binding protein, partial [Phycisphaerae bacterium]
AGELIFRGFDPCYALISRHGEDITFWAYVVAAGIVLGSLFVTIPFCRWLCPLAAVLNLFSRFGLTRIKRDETVCTSCGKCARACPMAIPVDVLSEVTVARCTSCLNCVAVCPKASGSAVRVPESGMAAGALAGASAEPSPEARALKPEIRNPSCGALFWGPPNAIGRRWPQAALIAIMLTCIAGAVAAVYAFPMASFVHTRGEAPAQTSVLHLRVSGLTCRGAATRFTLYYLDRDDEFAVPGYLKIEAWPGPGYASARITYDPAQTNELAIKKAITEPYFNTASGTWDASPFRIEGYDPLGLDEVEPTTKPGS